MISFLFRHALFLAFTLILATQGQCVTYHVSPNGNDANSGTSPAQAWRTIQRVQQVAGGLQPGDQILFERGGVYPGQLAINSSGSSNNPIIIGAYGNGAQPIVSGSIPVTGWTIHQGNVWRAPMSQAVKYLRVGNSHLTLARTPNTGWLHNDNGSTTNLTSAQITQPSGTWTGARLVVRSTNWSYETRTITSHTNSTLTFPALQFNLSSYEWGFYLCNTLTALDSQGEWFHDPSSGQLYIWPTGNADPNGLGIQGAVHDHGIILGWQKQHVRIQDISFRDQRLSSVKNDGASYITVDNCSFDRCYMAISSYGNHDQYTNNTIANTYATAIQAVNENTVISNNILTDIAMVPGGGESAWGYFGIYIMGNGNTIRENRLENVGYSGLFLKGNPLVERNYIRNALAITNDGGGIHFDEVNGMIVRDNIILDLIGSLEGSAPDHSVYYEKSNGIYFGFRDIRNSIFQRNTIAGCKGDGIHVDHSMVSSGNQVIDNVLYDNNGQLGISDYSNIDGAGAVAPYHVSNYNTVYSGNVMYSLTRDQRCMKQSHTYSATNPVDFGTFTNNRYFNPFNELSIEVQNVMAGTRTYYTLERWQNQVGEDVGSQRSPLSLNAMEVTNVLGTNLIANGNMDYNVNGWGGWPSQGQITRDNNMLDNGSLRVQFSNPSTYAYHYLRPDAMSTLNNGSWYLLSLSLQSTSHGVLTIECKTQSQFTGPNSIMERNVPFDQQRRELSVIFQSDVNEPAVCRFLNHFSEPQYWIDNVQLRQVAVTEIDPHERHVLFLNDGGTTAEISLDGCWRNVDGQLVEGSITLAPFRSAVLIREPDEICGLSTGSEEIDHIITQEAIYPNPVRSGGTVQWLGGSTDWTEYELFDVAGRSLMRGRITSRDRGLALDPGLASGVHMLHLRDDDRSAAYRLIID